MGWLESLAQSYLGCHIANNAVGYAEEVVGAIVGGFFVAFNRLFIRVDVCPSSRSRLRHIKRSDAPSRTFSRGLMDSTIRPVRVAEFTSSPCLERLYRRARR